MDETKGMNFFAYIIAFVIIVWVISAMTGGCGFGFGFNRGGCGNYGGDNLFENYKATVDAKISEIINTATTQNLVNVRSAENQATTIAQANMLATKIDFYEYQNLRDKLSESQRENLMLRNQIYNDGKFGALENQISRIECQMLKQPRLSGVAVACPSNAVINNNPCGGCNGSIV